METYGSTAWGEWRWVSELRPLWDADAELHAMHNSRRSEPHVGQRVSAKKRPESTRGKMVNGDGASSGPFRPIGRSFT